MVNQRRGSQIRTSPTIISAIFERSRNPEFIAQLIAQEVKNAPNMPFVTNTSVRNVTLGKNRHLKFTMDVSTIYGDVETGIDVTDRITPTI